MKDYKNEYPLNTFSGETKKELEKLLDKVRKETEECERKRIKENIGFLRQYLNERTSDELVTDEEIKTFLI